MSKVVRLLVGLDWTGGVSLGLWALRKRHGVPSGAVEVSYSRTQRATQMLVLFVVVVDAVMTELLVRGFGAPPGARTVILALDVYSVLFVLGVIAGCATRPHVVSGDEVRIRYGAFFDLRIPREQIASARPLRNLGESGMVRVVGEEVAVSVSSQTNVALELTGPITVVRPFGGRADVRTVRFYADDPEAVHAALAA